MGHADGAYSLFAIGKAFIDILEPTPIGQCANGTEESIPCLTMLAAALSSPTRNPSRILRIARIWRQCRRSEGDGIDIVRVRRPLAHSAKLAGPPPDKVRQHGHAHDRR